MTFIVMTFDRIEVSGLFESRVIPIKISNPFVNTRIPFTNCSVVAFEDSKVDSSKRMMVLHKGRAEKERERERERERES